MSEKILERLAINNFNYRRWSFDYFLRSVKELDFTISNCADAIRILPFSRRKNFPWRSLRQR